MFEATDNRNRKRNKIHLVQICNETGIYDAFRIIKERLGSIGDTYISLIYSLPENIVIPLFEKEITILEKRFSHNLYAYTLKVEPGKYDVVQELIEAIINSNIDIQMHFMIYGNEEFVDYVSEILRYLNIDAHSIKSTIY